LNSVKLSVYALRFSADMLRHAVTLIFDLLTLNVCNTEVEQEA